MSSDVTLTLVLRNYLWLKHRAIERWSGRHRAEIRLNIYSRLFIDHPCATRHAIQYHNLSHRKENTRKHRENMNGENEYNSRSNAILMTSEATAGGGGGAARKRLIELSTFLDFFSCLPVAPLARSIGRKTWRRRGDRFDLFLFGIIINLCTVQSMDRNGRRSSRCQPEPSSDNLRSADENINRTNSLPSCFPNRSAYLFIHIRNLWTHLAFKKRIVGNFRINQNSNPIDLKPSARAH